METNENSCGPTKTHMQLEVLSPPCHADTWTFLGKNSARRKGRRENTERLRSIPKSYFKPKETKILLLVIFKSYLILLNSKRNCFFL